LRKVGIGVFVSALFLAGTAAATPIYLNDLPNLFLNQTAGNFRSNVAFTESDPLNTFDGTSVTLSQANLGADSAVITSISTWSVASIIGDPLGNEFTNVSLYFRAAGGTWQILTDLYGNPETGAPNTFFDSSNPNLVGNSNGDITHTLVSYRNGVPYYESLSEPGVFFPVWQNTFNNLHLVLQAGVTYEFAVWGTNPNADPETLYGYWFDHYSNPFLSGAREDDKSGDYLRCDATQLSAPCFIEDPKADQVWNKGAVMNIDLEGVPTPEPSTIFLSGAALVGVLLFSRNRHQTSRS
jgi:hypothetical protein